MADMTPLTDILNDDPATATPVQNNFQTIEAYINGTDLVRTDGTEVMAADLDLDGNTLANISGLAMNATKITGLAVPTAATDAARLGDAAKSDYQVNATSPVITTSPTTVCTFTVYSDAAGMAYMTFFGEVTGSGITFGSNAVTLSVSVSGATLLQTVAVGSVGANDTSALTATTTNLVSLAAGTNTIVVSFARVNGDATGGTVTLGSNFRAMIVGA